MTSLRIETLYLPAAEVGPENPLPVLAPPRPASAVPVDPSVPDWARTYLGYGCGPDILPYRLQDGYTQARQPRPFKTAVLENEVLRATFLLEYGGRLRSLFHKRAGRELLYVNPVFQPANFAARNAWFSGGIEWNCGIPGHTPLTCSPMFAAEVAADEGWPVLRMWEFERQRAAPYQIDFILPPGSPWLLVRVRLFNPHETTLPMYWWSNVAVPESPDARVLAPARAAYNFGYQGILSRVPAPIHDGRDVSYPTHVPVSADFFYEIDPAQRPWLTSLDGAGAGLIQTSTAAQRGRKLFVWGMGVGGRQWQKLLTEGDFPYCEIQAGVARTQYESFPMAARSELTWLEAYGLMEADPAAVHGRDWPAALDHVERRLEAALPAARLDQIHRATAVLAEREPGASLHSGSGWGALEARRRPAAGEKPLCPPAIPFDEASLTAEQRPWLALMDTGRLPEADEPGAWLVQAAWRARLEASADDHWLAWLHRGVMRYAAGDTAGAEAAWNLSLQRRRTPWALRNLAVCAQQAGRLDEAAGRWQEARALQPDLAPLAAECLAALVAAGRPEAALDLALGLPAAVAAHGRVRALQARAALEAGHLDQAEAILLGALVVPDLREGDLLLSDLWYELQARRAAQAGGTPVTDEIRRRVRQQCALPAHLDFRQAAT